MEIIFDGEYTSEEAMEHVNSIIHLFEERYHLRHFREMHLSLTLVNAAGEEVELVDSETSEVYRVLEVCREGKALKTASRPRQRLALVIDNTRNR